MADISNQSIGRVMGDWLTDTVDGAQMVAKQIQKAKDSPKLAMREMRAMIAGTLEEVDTMAEEIRFEGWAKEPGQKAPLVRGRAPAPTSSKATSSNTGLNEKSKSIKTSVRRG